MWALKEVHSKQKAQVAKYTLESGNQRTEIDTNDPTWKNYFSFRFMKIYAAKMEPSERFMRCCPTGHYSKHTKILPQSIPGEEITPNNPLDGQNDVAWPEEWGCLEEMTDEDIIQLVSSSNDKGCNENEDNYIEEPPKGPESSPCSQKLC